MDSGSAVPTLNAGLRATVAEKLFTVAKGRGAGVISRPPARITAASARVVGSGEAASRLLEIARFLTLEKTGRRIAVRTAKITMTTTSSMSVNALSRFPTAPRRALSGSDEALGKFREGW